MWELGRCEGRRWMRFGSNTNRGSECIFEISTGCPRYSAKKSGEDSGYTIYYCQSLVRQGVYNFKSCTGRELLSNFDLDELSILEIRQWRYAVKICFLG